MLRLHLAPQFSVHENTYVIHGQHELRDSIHMRGKIARQDVVFMESVVANRMRAGGEIVTEMVRSRAKRKIHLGWRPLHDTWRKYRVIMLSTTHQVR